MILQNTTLCTF